MLKFAFDLAASRPRDVTVDTGPGQDAILFAVPVLAWSRFVIPSGTIAADQLSTLRVQLQAHVFAADARIGLADYLWSPDQLPQSYVETAQLAERLTKAALHGKDVRIDTASMPETANFLSDIRYLIGVVAAPRGTAMFRWQEDDGSRAETLRAARRCGARCRPAPSSRYCPSPIMPRPGTPTALRGPIRFAPRLLSCRPP